MDEKTAVCTDLIPCPRCGEAFDPKMPALSRAFDYDDSDGGETIYVCGACGYDESRVWNGAAPQRTIIPTWAGDRAMGKRPGLQS